jgi:hypothetical protein
MSPPPCSDGNAVSGLGEVTQETDKATFETDQTHAAQDDAPPGPVADLRGEFMPRQTPAFLPQVIALDPRFGGAQLQGEPAHTGLRDPRSGRDDRAHVAVAHRRFIEMGSMTIMALGKSDALLYDIKGIFGKSGSDLRL